MQDIALLSRDGRGDGREIESKEIYKSCTWYFSYLVLNSILRFHHGINIGFWF